jgi:hypothetical protein
LLRGRGGLHCRFLTLLGVTQDADNQGRDETSADSNHYENPKGTQRKRIPHRFGGFVKSCRDRERDRDWLGLRWRGNRFLSHRSRASHSGEFLDGTSGERPPCAAGTARIFEREDEIGTRGVAVSRILGESSPNDGIYRPFYGWVQAVYRGGFFPHDSIGKRGNGVRREGLFAGKQFERDYSE